MALGKIKPFMEIDSILTDGGTVVLSGWALSYYRDSVTFTIRDRSGKTVPTDISIQRRLDPGRTIFGDDSHPNAGFRLSFQGSADEEYTLIVSDGVSKRKNRFLPSGYSLQWKYRPNAFFREYGKRFFEILPTIGDEGSRRFFRQMRGDFRKEEYRYRCFIDAHAPSEAELAEERNTVFPYMPKFSLVVPAYRTPERFLREAIDSVRNGSYQNFEICVADGSYPDTSVTETLKAIAAEDPRIVYKTLDHNGGISENTNEAIAMATGDWIVLMDHDDLFAPNALFEFAKAINEHPDAGAVYSDEDKISMDLYRRFQPAFKPDFDQIYLTSNNYICHLFAVKREVAEDVGPFERACDGAQDQDYILRVTERTKTVHIPKVLYHWRTSPWSTAGDSESKMYCYEAGALSVNRFYERNAIDAKSFVSDFYGHYDSFFRYRETPLISVIFFGDGERSDRLRTEQSVRSASPYENYEFLDGFSRIREAKGDYLLFIRKGSEIKGKTRTDGDETFYAFPYNFLARLASPNAGAVGGKVVDQNRRITYAGTMKSKTHLVDMILRNEDENVTALNGKALDARLVPTVSAECMMIKRDVFTANGGFDPSIKRFPSADLCLRLLEVGFVNVYEPSVTVTTPFSNSQRQAFLIGRKEAKLLAKRHRDNLSYDETSNPNVLIHMDRYCLKE